MCYINGNGTEGKIDVRPPNGVCADRAVSRGLIPAHEGSAFLAF